MKKCLFKEVYKNSVRRARDCGIWTMTHFLPPLPAQRGRNSTLGIPSDECKDALPTGPSQGLLHHTRKYRPPAFLIHPKLHGAEAKFKTSADKRTGVPFFHPGYTCRIIACLRQERLRTLEPDHHHPSLLTGWRIYPGRSKPRKLEATAAPGMLVLKQASHTKEACPSSVPVPWY